MSRQIRDLTGQRFGKLHVKVIDSVPHGKCARWLCVCECGNEKVLPLYSLHGGKKDCGCARNIRRVHPVEYSTWYRMKRRCYDPKDKAYKDYGGRGITVSDEWREDFAAFLRDMGPRPAGRYSIDRIKNDQGYSKGNCRWATPTEQARNTRRAIYWHEAA